MSLESDFFTEVTKSMKKLSKMVQQKMFKKESQRMQNAYVIATRLHPASFESIFIDLSMEKKKKTWG